MKIVDSHLHLDIVRDKIIFDYICQNLRAIIIWSYCEPHPKTFADLTAYFEHRQAFAVSCTTRGLPCFCLAGIHPRNIPLEETATQAKVNALLAKQLPYIQGIGEIGLETGSDAEKEILAMQMHFARQNGLKACVHTPRKNKNEMMDPALQIIEQSGINRNDVIIDHLNSGALVWTIVNMGYYAGITIAPVKSQLDDVLQILKENEANLDRIMLNSDLAMARLQDYKLYVDSVNALPPEYEITGGQTALNFFNIKL